MIHKLQKKDKDWLYSEMIEAINKITDSIILMFSPINLSSLQNISAK